MTTSVAVPGGDPAALRSVATRLGGLASEHAGQLSSFHGNVQTALAGWKGPLAVQYAVAAGQCSARFTAVSTQLKAAQMALSKYAQALEEAQKTVTSVNGKLGQGHPSSSAKRQLSTQADDAVTTLNGAARQCAIALHEAEAGLATACPDTLTVQQLLAIAKRAASDITSPGAITAFNFMLSAYALYADAKGGAAGAAAGKALTASESLVKLLGEEKLSPQILNLLAHVKNPSSLTVAWERVQARALVLRDGAQAAAAEKGGSLLEGLVKANTIDIADAGAHAGAQSAVDVFLRTSKVGLVLAPVTIGLGVYSILNPGDGPTWERDGNITAGVASTVGGSAQLMAWSATALGMDWEVPGLDVATAATLIGSAAWTVGDLIYDERHNIAKWIDGATSKIAHGFDAAKNEAGQLIDGAANTVVSGFDGATSKIAQGFDAARNEAGQLVDGAANTVVSGFDGATSKIAKGFDAAKNEAGQLVDGATNTISQGFDDATSKIASGFDKTTSTAGHVLSDVGHDLNPLNW